MTASPAAATPDAPYVSVLIPARDEAENIREVVERTARAFAALGLDADAAELVLVDDGSIDGTGDLADSLVQDYPFLRVIRHRRNLRPDCCAAHRLRRRARRVGAVFLPADLESDPEDGHPRLLEAGRGL